jgi:hypothetical protein
MAFADRNEKEKQNEWGEKQEVRMRERMSIRMNLHRVRDGGGSARSAGAERRRVGTIAESPTRGQGTVSVN